MVFIDGRSNRKAETPRGPGTARLSDVMERSGGETEPAWWGLGGGSFQVVAAPGAGCPHLSMAGVLPVPTKERTCPSTADQQAARGDRNPLSSVRPQCQAHGRCLRVLGEGVDKHGSGVHSWTGTF